MIKFFNKDIWLINIKLEIIKIIALIDNKMIKLVLAKEFRINMINNKIKRNR